MCEICGQSAEQFLSVEAIRSKIKVTSLFVDRRTVLFLIDSVYFYLLCLLLKHSQQIGVCGVLFNCCCEIQFHQIVLSKASFASSHADSSIDDNLINKSITHSITNAVELWTSTLPGLFNSIWTFLWFWNKACHPFIHCSSCSSCLRCFHQNWKIFWQRVIFVVLSF